jgi:hypothetical protein
VKNVGVSLGLALGLDPSLLKNVGLSLVLLGAPILSGHFRVGVAIVYNKIVVGIWVLLWEKVNEIITGK